MNRAGNVAGREAGAMLQPPCQICGRKDYPHICGSFTVLNSLYYCPGGAQHIWLPRKWPFRDRCFNCGRKGRRGVKR